MKITNVRAYVVEPFTWEWAGITRPLRWMFLRIDTDEGITGWGEGSSFPHHGSEMVGLGALAAKELLIGEDPTNIEVIWQKMFRRHTSVGARGITSAVVSAVDIALWDITGKAAGKPVYELLGGQVHEKLRSYTYLYPEEGDATDVYAELTRSACNVCSASACHERLGRNTSDVHARATELALLDDGDAQTFAVQPIGKRWACLPGTDNDCIESFRHGFLEFRRVWESSWANLRSLAGTR